MSHPDESGIELRYRCPVCAGGKWRFHHGGVGLWHCALCGADCKLDGEVMEWVGGIERDGAEDKKVERLLTEGSEPSWEDSNRAFCNWLHRGKVSCPPAV